MRTLTDAMLRHLGAAALFLILSGAAGAVHAATLREDVRAWRASHEPEVVGELVDLTRLKSVAADPAGHIHRAPRHSQRVGYSFNGTIAGAMAVAIVDELEAVDIEQHDCERSSRS